MPGAYARIFASPVCDEKFGGRCYVRRVFAPRHRLASLLVLVACSGDPSGADASAGADSSTTTNPGTTAPTTAAPTTGEHGSSGDPDAVTTGTTSGAVTTEIIDTSETTAPVTTSTTMHESTTDETTTDETTGEMPLVCPQVADPVEIAELDDKDIEEASGLVASRTQPGVFWVHNDSGDDPRFFAVDGAGQRLGVFNVGGGADAEDWEDMSSGPGPGPGEYLYFGDIGDNAEKRAKITVYRVPEPDAASARGGEVDLDDVEILDLVYPDTAHNAETLLVDPQTGDLVIVAKGVPTRVFVLPGPVAAGGPYMLEEVAPIDFAPVIATGGDISPNGEFIAVRTYTVALLWLRPPGTSIAEAFAGAPCPIPLADESQGETLSFAGDGSGYYTVSEGSEEPLYWYAFNN